MTDFLILTFLIGFCIFCFVKAYQITKRNRIAKKIPQPEPKVEIRIEQPEAYQLYSSWCRERNEKALSIDDFEKLVNTTEDITIEKLLDYHIEFNKKTYNEILRNDFMSYYETMERQRFNHDRNQKFFTSVATGYATKSALGGTLLGGDLFGGILGSRLRNRKKRK